MTTAAKLESLAKPKTHEGGDMKEGKEIITWDQFVDAVGKFADDLEIVKHPDDPIKTPFEKPESDKYFLTVSRRLIAMGEKEFLARLQQGPVVLATMCMDKRGAEGTYQSLLTKAKQEYPGAQIVILSMGGGAAQEEEVIRPGGVIPNYNRRQALRTIINYIRQNTPSLVGEFHSVHSGQCGALKFSHNDEPVAKRFNVPVCSMDEGLVALDTAHDTIDEELEINTATSQPINFLLAHFWLKEGDPDISNATFADLIHENEVRQMIAATKAKDESFK